MTMPCTNTETPKLNLSGGEFHVSFTERRSGPALRHKVCPQNRAVNAARTWIGSTGWKCTSVFGVPPDVVYDS